MTLDFVSEVDRKFYSNNLLTNDDWGKNKIIKIKVQVERHMTLTVTNIMLTKTCLQEYLYRHC